MSDARIRVSQLVFSWPDGTPVFDGLSVDLGRSRTGLVAPNGAGKSTLLRLLVGELRPLAGQIECVGVVGYLPQRLPRDGDACVAELLGVAARLHALDAVLAGDANPAHFEILDGDWTLRERIAATLSRLGLDGIDLQRSLASLSGGEAMSLALAAQLLRRPDVLLLDEPSNHLDRDARQRLYRVLSDWPGCLLVASHDRELLDAMAQTAELKPTALRLFGGGYSFYRQAVETEQHAAEQRVRTLRADLRRERQEQQQARERAARRTGRAARTVADAGLPRIVVGQRARSAQVSAARADQVHGDRVSQVQDRLKSALAQIDAAEAIDFSLPETRVPADRVLFAGTGLCVRAGERWLFAPAGVDFSLRGPERVAVLGGNGVGKTSLLRLLAGELAPVAGSLRRAQGRVAYLSQRLDLIDPTRTVAEHFAEATPTMPSDERANRLARLQFRGTRRNLPLAALSGGERLRAVLACLLHAEPAPQLLLLDEPTNNLDLAAIEQLELALRAYQGGLVVVSHDAAFLAAIGIDRHLLLTQDGLFETNASQIRPLRNTRTG